MKTNEPTTTHTRESLAALLNGREYTEEITREEEQAAKISGLLVIFGASDDLMEFRGSIHDEIGAPNREPILFDAKGIIPPWEQINHNDEDEARAYFTRKQNAGVMNVQAIWCDNPDAPAWTYKTDLPHSTFEIKEGDEVFCRGIVIDMTELK